MLNDQPIVAVVTKTSGNTKTGDSWQLWILPATLKPNEAVKTGDDASVCGNCKHRPLIAKKTRRNQCYVKTFQAPRSIWEAFGRGRYETKSPQWVNVQLRKQGAVLRLGAWGDPAALPRSVVEPLCWKVRKLLGYTHQWRNPKFDWLKRFCMASVDTFAEYCRAQKAGWRSFFNCANEEEYERAMALHEVVACPASKEMGATLTCAECLACDGRKSADDFRANVIIKQH